MRTVKTGYNLKVPFDPLFLEEEDYKNEPEKWNMIKELFGLGKIDNVSVIKVDISTVEYFVEKET